MPRGDSDAARSSPIAEQPDSTPGIAATDTSLTTEQERAMTPRLFRSGARPIQVQAWVAGSGGFVLVLVVVVTLVTGHQPVVAVSAGACWIALLCLGVSLWNLIRYARTGHGVLPFWPLRIPERIGRWLPHACLMLGVVLGHWLWH
jgi:hypothetical protein